MTNVGSRPPSASTDAMRLVVVVLPCVPATAMPCFRRISSASISARGTTGIAALARGDDFRIVRRDRRRHDDGVGAGDVRRACPIATATPSRARRVVTALAARSEPRDLIALRGQHFGDAAHAGAADADEMDALDLVLHRPAPQAMQASATRSAASRRASLRAATAIASSASRANDSEARGQPFRA